jgi:urease accessory protein
MDTGIDLEQLTSALYLSSPALPIGAYSYSQGLEAAVDANIVRSETDVGDWILDGLQEIVGPGEAAAVAWQYRFWSGRTFDEMQGLNAWFLASRESAVLRQETEQMGWSLARIALSLNWADELSRQALSNLIAVAFPTAFAFSAVTNGLSIGTTLAAYCFSWVQTQVSTALRGVPLGQESGQRLLQRIRPEIPKVVEKTIQVERDEITTFAPMLGIFSSRHETQAFRMFRS